MAPFHPLGRRASSISPVFAYVPFLAAHRLGCRSARPRQGAWLRPHHAGGAAAAAKTCRGSAFRGVQSGCRDGRSAHCGWGM